ncbi:MAG: MazG family protein, partial [Candidatus Dormiibacterota bacterium]
MRDEAAQALRQLNEVVERLRAPGGCPWDREQTHRSLRPYLLEETYELLEAIDYRGPETLREELGDLLLQVLMHCAIAAESPDGFDIGDVAETTRAKMIHRHPHVFGDASVRDAAEVVVNWERLKRTEKRDRLSLLDGVPHALPALAFAQGVQKRPARVGFDETPSVASALDLVRAAVDAVVELAATAPRRVTQGGDWVVTDGAVTRVAAGSA